MEMYVLSEVCNTKTVSVEAGQILVSIPIAGDGDACGNSSLATRNTLRQVLPHLAIHNPRIRFINISLCLDSRNREDV